MTTATKGTLKRSIKRGVRTLLYALAARWLQKHGISIPVPDLVGAVMDPATLSGGLTLAAGLGLDKALREKWATIARWFKGE